MRRWTQGPLAGLISLLVMVGSPALAVEDSRPRPLDFDQMDTNIDGLVSFSEWLVWFHEDIDAASPDAFADARDPSIPVVRLKNAEGVEQVLVARPFAMGSPEEVAVDNDRYGDDRIQSPIAARARMLRDQAVTRPFPEFDGYDTDGDRHISREEMNRTVPAFPNPIPPLDSDTR